VEQFPGQGSGAEYDPHELRLSPEADDLRLAFATWLEPRLAPTADLGHIADWAGKLVGSVLRIAGNLHMADHAGEPAPWEKAISGQVLERAIRIGHYLLAHARAAFSQMGMDPVVSDARHILAWIHRNQHTAFTRRDLFEGTKGRFRQVGALALPLDLLIRHGYIRERDQEERPGPGRKPSPTYDVNPLIGPQNSQYPAPGPKDGSTGLHPANHEKNGESIRADEASQSSAAGSRSEPSDPDSANPANSAYRSGTAEVPDGLCPSQDPVDFEEGTL
jgi:hypothetical protein